jgi:hypothetical protein
MKWKRISGMVEKNGSEHYRMDPFVAVDVSIKVFQNLSYCSHISHQRNTDLEAACFSFLCQWNNPLVMAFVIVCFST